jgi:predicted exporter/SAM-dependent methyltransferase
MNTSSVYGRRLIITLIVIALLFLVGWSRLTIEADVVGFLPKGDSVVADGLDIFQHHPIQDQLIVDIGLQEENLALLVECGQLVEKHLRQSKLFKTVGLEEFQSLIPDLAFHVVTQMPVLFSAEDLHRRVEPLLDPQSVRRKLSAVQTSLLNLEGIGQSAFIARDPLGLKDIIMERLAHLAPAQSARVYKGQIISEDGQHLLVTADSSVSSTDTTFARQAADLMETIAADVNKTYGGSGHEITLTPMGAYRVALDNELIARKDVRNAILLATLGIVLLLVFTFPRPYLGVLSLLPAIAGTTAAFCMYSLLHETISLMVLGFGGAIISISVDHGIAYLLFLDRPYRTYGKEASREVRAVGLVAALTTMGAFSALMFSGFPILEQLGLFTALGIAFSFIFVHTIFPRIFSEMPAARTRQMRLHGLVDRLSRTGKTGLITALVFAVVMLFFIKPDFNVSLDTMNTVSSETKAAEKMISKVWGSVFHKVYLMTQGETLIDLQARGDEVAAMITREQQAGSLSSGFAPSMIFPGIKRQQDNVAAWKTFWSVQRRVALERAFQNVSGDLGFASDAFDLFFKTLTTERPDAGAMTIPKEYFRLLGIGRDGETKTWRQISGLTTGNDYHAEEFIEKYVNLGKFFDPDFFSERLGRLLFATFTKMLAIIGLSVFILLLLYFVDISLVLIALLPVGFALVSTLGSLKLMGRPLDIPSLMLAIIIIGMGVDYSLFFVRSYQRYDDAAHPHHGLIRMTVFLAGASTIIGFGVLSAARHSLLRSAGISLLLGISYSLIGAFVILPPLLNSLKRNRMKKPAAGGIRGRVLQRFCMLEAYPRLFARFKMRFDPMFTELPGILDASEGAQTIMDIGCGYGVQTAWMLERFPGAEVVAMDPDAGRIHVAARVTGKRARLSVGGAPDIPIVSKPVDLVIMLDIAHYLHDQALQQTLNRLYDRLKNNGRLIIRVTIPPKRRYPLLYWVEEIRLRLTRVPSFYRSVKTLQILLEEAGFKIEQTAASGNKGELRWLIAAKKTV